LDQREHGGAPLPGEDNALVDKDGTLRLAALLERLQPTVEGGGIATAVETLALDAATVGVACGASAMWPAAELASAAIGWAGSPVFTLGGD
jgi:hypothetical protein